MLAGHLNMLTSSAQILQMYSHHKTCVRLLIFQDKNTIKPQVSKENHMKRKGYLLDERNNLKTNSRP